MPLSFQLTLECIVESYPEPYVVWRWEGKDKGTRGVITLGNTNVSRRDEALLFI